MIDCIKVIDFQKAKSTLFSRLCLKLISAIKSCMFNLWFTMGFLKEVKLKKAKKAV